MESVKGKGKTWKKVLSVTFVVLLLGATGWGIQNWLGARAWEEARARAKAAGVSLVRADYAGPEIPEDEDLRFPSSPRGAPGPVSFIRWGPGEGPKSQWADRSLRKKIPCDGNFQGAQNECGEPGKKVSPKPPIGNRRPCFFHRVTRFRDFHNETVVRKKLARPLRMLSLSGYAVSPSAPHHVSFPFLSRLAVVGPWWPSEDAIRLPEMVENSSVAAPPGEGRVFLGSQ